MQNGHFPCKIVLHLKKVCYKVSLCEYCDVLIQHTCWVAKLSVITSKRYEIGCQLVLITNRKSHTGFQLVPTSVTLNDFERRNSPYFSLFHQI